ncbi:LexA family transcriptional regulator [Parasphingorhabdus sp.]|uniref:LexA family transcriptional regulator n=1 Tax=Parasphingorhabdus sp. TaxID=2709688 RepID=UPI002F9236CF
MLAAGRNQSELARNVGLKQPSIGRLLSGDTKKTGVLHLIARDLQTTPEYLTGESDNPGAAEDSQPFIPAPNLEDLGALQLKQMGLALIPELELGYSMGGGNVIEMFEHTGVAPFKRDWLRPIMKGSFDDLFVAKGEGDSMIPTMLDGDIVLIDTAQKDILQQDRIWALSYGDLGMIKRVRKLPDGGYQINSDNQAVTPMTAYDGEMHVIGRVIWVGRRM